VDERPLLPGSVFLGHITDNEPKKGPQSFLVRMLGKLLTTSKTVLKELPNIENSFFLVLITLSRHSASIIALLLKYPPKLMLLRGRGAWW
jgi:hypothetical protein